MRAAGDLATRRGGIATWLVVAMLQLIACSRDSDEKQIRDLIAATEVAVEARDTSDVMQSIANAYSDDQGNDRSQVQQFLRGYFLTHPKIELLVRVAEIKVETATRARARIEFALVGTRVAGDSQIALAGEWETLQVDFRRIDAKWRIERVERMH